MQISQIKNEKKYDDELVNNFDKKFDVFLIDRSLSFVLCMAGFAFVLLAFCYVTIDVYKVWSGAPFYFPGKDGCFITVCHRKNDLNCILFYEN